MGPAGVSSDWRSFKKDVFFSFISGSRKLLSELFTLFSIQDFFRLLVWLESSNICFWMFWLNVSRYFLFIFVFDWSFYTASVMLYDDSIILIVNIFRVISFDNLIHIIVLRHCFVRTRRDLVDWFIFFSSLCVSFFLVSPQLSKWFPDTLWKQNCWVCWEDSQIRCPLKCIDLNITFLFVFFQMWTFLIFARSWSQPAEVSP